MIHLQVSISTTSPTSFVHPIKRKKTGTMYPMTSSEHSTVWVFLKPNRNGLVVSPLNTKAKRSITRFERISKNKVFSSLTWIQDSKSTLKLSRNTSGRSFLTPTTNSLRSTQRFGPVARSFTCRKASMSRCLFRPTSASTPRTWVSLSERSSSLMKVHRFTTSKDALHQLTRQIPCIPRWLN